jgi:hypothetical protein
MTIRQLSRSTPFKKSEAIGNTKSGAVPANGVTTLTCPRLSAASSSSPRGLPSI